MPDFCFIHGSWHGAWCFAAVRTALGAQGHRSFAADLPCDDPGAGLADYAKAAAHAFAAADNPVLVAHSLGGLTAPLVAKRIGARQIVFLAAVLPTPGKSYAQQLAEEPMRCPDSYPALVPDADGRVLPDLATAIGFLFHDLPAETALACHRRLRPQALRPVHEITPLGSWPTLPQSFIACRGDRALNPAYAFSVPSERYGMTTHALDGGHSPFASRPGELATLLVELVERRSASRRPAACRGVAEAIRQHLSRSRSPVPPLGFKPPPIAAPASPPADSHSPSPWPKNTDNKDVPSC